jgi:hypothetical protein
MFMLKESVTFLLRPSKAGTFDIAYSAIFKYLFFLGLFRGVGEFVLNIFINREQELILSIFRAGHGLDWFMEMPLPFILWNIITAYFLWAFISFMIKKTGRLLGGEVDNKKIEVACAYLMTLYITVPIFNLLHLILDVPYYRYFKSFGFAPYIGVGEVLEAVWAVMLMCFIAKRLLKLSSAKAIAVALSPVFVGYGMWVFSGVVFVEFFTAIGMPLAVRSTYAIVLYYSITMGALTIYFLKN